MKLSARSLAPALLASLLLTPGFASAQEWTRFRGPNGSGISDTSFPAKFSDKDFAWNITLPGSGHCSPVVWGDKIFLTCTDDETAMRRVVCVSAKDGGIEWKKEYASHTYPHHIDNSYTSATPVVDAERVYVCWSTPEEFTLRALTHDGTEVWKTDLGVFISQHGSGNSPIIVGDMILIGDDQEGKESFLFGLDRASGKIVWKIPRKTKKFSASTPSVFHPKSGPDQVVFTSQAEGMTGLDPKTGKVIWQTSDVFDSRTIGSPTPGDGLIFATCGEGPGGHVLVAVRPGADGTAEVAWKVKAETPYVPTPLVKGELLFYWSDRGMVTCAHAATGKTIWQEKVSGSYYSSPVCGGNMLFNVSKKGEVIAISASEKFELLGQTSLNDKVQSSIAISGGHMYIHTFTHLVSIKGSGGQARAE